MICFAYPVGPRAYERFAGFIDETNFFMRPSSALTLPLVSASRATNALEESAASASGQEGAPTDGGQDEHAGDDCCILCTPGVNAALLALFRCDAAPARVRASAALRDSLSDVTQFLDGLVIYALSKEWNDLFSIYVFQRPLCRKQGPPRFGQNGTKQASPAPEHALRRPKLRPAPANQPPALRWPAMRSRFDTGCSRSPSARGLPA